MIGEMHSKRQTGCEHCNPPAKEKRVWLPFAIYLMGVAACLSAGGGIAKGAAIYCAIVFVTKGRDGIFGKSHNARISGANQ